MTHQFSQAPGVDIPRSSFNRSNGHKTTIDIDYLYPVYWDEALPGDTITVNPYIFGLLNTPLFPIMDNLDAGLEFFSVPIRQIWDNWRKFMGEQVNPGDSIDYTIPVTAAPASTGWNTGSLADIMGIPPGVPDIEVSSLPFRAFWHIYNEWYRDQNLINSVFTGSSYRGNGPDNSSIAASPPKRGKRHDYFTSGLPWLQKGDAVDVPLGSTAPVVSDGSPMLFDNQTGDSDIQLYNTAASNNAGAWDAAGGAITNASAGTEGWHYNDQGLQVDLTSATAATINQLRQAFQIQKLLERDARSGTRYSEIVKSHFGVDFFDITYRPEYLGGTNSRVNINQVAVTSDEGTGNPGKLGAYGTFSIQGKGGFTKSFTEHCIVIGILSVRADITYQQGVERAWWRSTRYDFYWPALAHIGEQAIYTRELYAQDPTTDTGATGTPDNEKVFAYQERWAEYRYKNSLVTGKMRSAATGTLDAWHLSQEFSSLPTLNQTFIESTTPIDRVVAVSTEPDFKVDMFFDARFARPMPLYSVPGLIDHF